MMTEPATLPRATAHPPGRYPGESQPFTVPARHNPRLSALAERINADEELRALWRCANLNAVDRLGLGDCGEVHVRIVANAGLKLLRLLRDGGIAPSLVEHHRLSMDEAEAVVVLAAALHELGLAAAAGDAQAAGLALAAVKGRELLADLYAIRERTVILAETLHAIGAQPAGAPCLTLEAGVLRLADVLDLTKGRVRAPADATRGVVGAEAVEAVTIQKSKQPPVRVIVRLGQPGDLHAIETLLHHHLRGSGLEHWVELLAQLDNPDDGRLVRLRAWDLAPARPA
jgi:metal-dependent HD superfamily phosphatase/phosphodiesterase